MKYAFALLVVLLFSTQGEAKPSDGCSFGVSKFYRQVFGKPPSFEHCCDAHDRSYARPGTADTRLIADNELAACIAKIHPFEASIIWLGVRAGGQPFHSFDWRQYRRDHSTRWQYERDRPE